MAKKATVKKPKKKAGAGAARAAEKAPRKPKAARAPEGQGIAAGEPALEPSVPLEPTFQPEPAKGFKSGFVAIVGLLDLLGIAKSIVSPNVLDFIPLADDYMIGEIAPPSGFIGKTIGELQLRGKYHIDVIAVRDVLTEKITMVPAANFVVKDSEVLIVVGKEVDIDKIK